MAIKVHLGCFEGETFMSEGNVRSAQLVGFGYLKDGLQLGTCPKEYP